MQKRNQRQDKSAKSFKAEHHGNAEADEGYFRSKTTIEDWVDKTNEDLFRLAGKPYHYWGHSPDEIREKLILNNLPLVRWVITRLRCPMPAYEDQISLGSIGLIYCVDHFDPDCGTKFSSYAKPRIAGEILDAATKESGLTRTEIQFLSLVKYEKKRQPYLNQSEVVEYVIKNHYDGKSLSSQSLIAIPQRTTPLFSIGSFDADDDNYDCEETECESVDEPDQGGLWKARDINQRTKYVQEQLNPDAPVNESPHWLAWMYRCELFRGFTVEEICRCLGISKNVLFARLPDPPEIEQTRKELEDTS